MLVLGDASLYGTGAYVAREVVALDPEVRIEITPGVPSPSACASILGEPLALGNENVTIVPDSEIDLSIERAFAMGGTVILMKLSRSIRNVLAHLERRGLLGHARCVIRAGQEGEEVVRDVRTLRGRDVPYMSTMVVKIPAPAEEEGPDAPRRAPPTVVSAPSRTSTTGKIFLVGIGPGHAEHLTPRARYAIEVADVVIGYVTYLKLVQEMLPGKEIVRGGMTEEVARALTAIEKAREGKTVALISSGDAGIYGMAAPTYEALLEAGWKPGESPEVEVVPGISAINAAASLLGAPLAHDFCAISLSDLLTPWAVIEKRLVAAAESDFITGLYNPKSGRRTKQLARAQEIFLAHRDPKTPVGVVKSAFRRRQRVDVGTLDTLQEYDIGMLTTVLIGNSATVRHGNLLVTPRGYKRKYDLGTAQVRAGVEKAPVGGEWSLGKGRS